MVCKLIQNTNITEKIVFIKWIHKMVNKFTCVYENIWSKKKKKISETKEKKTYEWKDDIRIFKNYNSNSNTHEKKEERKSSLTKNNTQKTVFLYSYFVKGWCIIVIANENGKMENGKK